MTDGKSPESDGVLSGRGGGGDSGGGAYPNPHSGKPAGGKDGLLGRGGQSGMAYHGGGGAPDAEADDNPNAPADR
ncbi:MAG TPA: hypothetical protein VHM92_05330 [Allosphingosinicella sp.]|nr:hypothetical protein [Allosphingosinicella sp.]